MAARGEIHVDSAAEDAVITRVDFGMPDQQQARRGGKPRFRRGRSEREGILH
jgi:hypothetical protein